MKQACSARPLRAAAVHPPPLGALQKALPQAVRCRHQAQAHWAQRARQACLARPQARPQSAARVPPVVATPLQAPPQALPTVQTRPTLQLCPLWPFRQAVKAPNNSGADPTIKAMTTTARIKKPHNWLVNARPSARLLRHQAWVWMSARCGLQ
jgi:hypothetical protein